MNVIHTHLSNFYDDVHLQSDPSVSKTAVNKDTLRRRDLLQRNDWNDWENSEWLQLNQFNRQGMFGTSCPRKHGVGLFNIVWTYSIKIDGSNTKKARCTCDSSPRSGQAPTLDHTYAAYIDQNAARLFYAITAQRNHIIAGGDASNAFGESEGPRQEYYL